jgi:hypothetical protein
MDTRSLRLAGKLRTTKAPARCDFQAYACIAAPDASTGKTFRINASAQQLPQILL